jgi:AsmA family/AsmA-like C-terminal region
MMASHGRTDRTKGRLLPLAWLLRAGLGLSLLLATLVALLLAGPTLDLSPYRPWIAEHLGALIGRDLNFDGALRVTLGRHARVSAASLRIANPAWAEAPELLRVAEVSAGLDLWGLASGVIHIEDVKVRDATASLEVASDGKRTWSLGRGDARKPARPAVNPSWGLALDRVEVDNLALHYRAPSTHPIDASVARFALRHGPGALMLNGTGTANGQPVQVQGRIGAASVPAAGGGRDVRLMVGLGEIRLALRGHVGALRPIDDIDLDARVYGPGLRGLLHALGIAYGGEDDTDLLLKVRSRARQLTWASRGHLGGLALSTHGEVAQPPQIEGLHLVAEAEGSDLGTLGRMLGATGLPVGPYRLQIELTRDDKGLDLKQARLQVGAASLELAGMLPAFPRLEGASARIDIAAKRPAELVGVTGSRPSLAGALRATAQATPLGDGRMQWVADADWAGHRLSAQGPLGTPPQFRGSQLRFEVAGASLAGIAAAFGAEGMPRQPYRISGTLAVDQAGVLRLKLDEGRAGDLRLSAQGSLGRLPDLVGADLNLSLSGPSWREAIGMQSSPSAQPFEIGARVRGDLRAPVIDVLSARVAGAELEARGTLGVGSLLTGTDVQVSAQVPRLDALLDLPSGSRWGSTPWRLSGHLRSADGGLRVNGLEIDGEPLHLRLAARARPIAKGVVVDGLRAELAGGEIAGKLTLERQARWRAELAATAHGLELGPLLAAWSQHAAPTPAARPDGRAIPDAPLAPGVLDAFDGGIGLSADALAFPDPLHGGASASHDLRLAASLQGGTLTLQRLRLSSDRGAMELAGTLAHRGDLLQVAGSLRGTDLLLGQPADGEGLAQLPRQDLKLDFRAQGRSWRELAASLDAKALLTGGPGRVRNIGLDLMLASVVDQLIGVLNPYRKAEPYTQIQCSAAALSAKDGVLRLVPGLAIRTDKLDVAALGTIDLRSERIDIGFKSTPREDIGLSAAGLVNPYVKVGGTLAQPQLVLDSTGALIFGTAAYATGGLSIVATTLFDRVSAVLSEPCAAVVTAARDRGAGTPLEHPLETLKDAWWMVLPAIP